MVRAAISTQVQKYSVHLAYEGGSAVQISVVRTMAIAC